MVAATLLQRISDWLNANKIPFPNREYPIAGPVFEGGENVNPVWRLGWDNDLMGNKLSVDVCWENEAISVVSMATGKSGLQTEPLVPLEVEYAPDVIRDLATKVYFPDDQTIADKFPEHDEVSDIRAGLSLGLKKRGMPGPVLIRVSDDPALVAKKVMLRWQTGIKPADPRNGRERLTWRFAYPDLESQEAIPFREVVSHFPQGLSDQDVAFARGYMGIGEPTTPLGPPTGGWS